MNAHMQQVRAAIVACIDQEAVVMKAQRERYDRTDPRSANQKAAALHNTQRKMKRLENLADDLVFCAATTDALGREARNVFSRVIFEKGYTQPAVDWIDGHA